MKNLVEIVACVFMLSMLVVVTVYGNEDVTMEVAQ